MRVLMIARLEARNPGSWSILSNEKLLRLREMFILQ
jgi:hypothetical protein